MYPPLTAEQKAARRREWIISSFKGLVFWSAVAAGSTYLANYWGWYEPHGEFAGLFPLCVIPSIFGAIALMALVSLACALNDDGDYNYDW